MGRPTLIGPPAQHPSLPLTQSGCTLHPVRTNGFSGHRQCFLHVASSLVWRRGRDAHGANQSPFLHLPSVGRDTMKSGFSLHEATRRPAWSGSRVEPPTQCIPGSLRCCSIEGSVTQAGS